MTGAVSLFADPEAFAAWLAAQDTPTRARFLRVSAPRFGAPVPPSSVPATGRARGEAQAAPVR